MLCPSEKGVRKKLMGCPCGEVGKLFISNGEMMAGHFCTLTRRWTIKDLPKIPNRELVALYDKLHHIGTG